MDIFSKKASILNKDFIMVVIGQIISIFGNSVVRFALPLYLLKETNSPSLFGIVSAIAFVPMIILCPIGGILADRINKRNIMVILDFTTATISGLFLLMMGHMNIVTLILITLILLYGIQGAYSPSVSASIPLLVPEKDIMTGNAIINMVNSLSCMIGPVIGGVIFGFAGVRPILFIAVGCFIASAVMEIFIEIPYKKSDDKRNIFKIGLGDMKDSLKFMTKEKRVIFKGCMLVAVINLVISSCVTIGLPVVITSELDLGSSIADRMYGYIEAAIGAGSLLGGLLAGILGKKVKITEGPKLLTVCGLTLVPMAAALLLPISGIISYWIIFVSAFIMMVAAAFISIQMVSYLQIITPNNMLGKVMSVASCVGMCACPLGQAIYGVAFDLTKSAYVFMVAFAINTIVAIASKGVFKEMGCEVEVKEEAA